MKKVIFTCLSIIFILRLAACSGNNSHQSLFCSTEIIYFDEFQPPRTFFEYDEKNSIGVLGHGFFFFRKKWYATNPPATWVEVPGGEIVEIHKNRLYFIWAQKDAKTIVLSYPYSQMNVLRCLKYALYGKEPPSATSSYLPANPDTPEMQYDPPWISDEEMYVETNQFSNDNHQDFDLR